ncbi:helix-turn-helix domain-containing protein [Halofilum ochraceum]|uniref:helix-turn-helix domain-containing protein n=1 Tax=Halofilum ochraceum TaxID=1611323 RepID=UPI00082A7CA9|nr:cupin domain-containing protein [Halofilum ochraceum]
MTPATDGQRIRASVGQDIRRLRRLKRITIKKLAAATGRSVGFLSQVERGLSEISVADLQQVTRALDVPLSWFFINDPAPPEERGYVVRSNARRQVGAREGGLVEELLSPDLGGSFEVFRSVFEPGAEMAVAERRNTEEAGYLVSGRLRLFLDDRTFDLETGDSFRFSGERYRWQNPGDETTIVIWVISPPVY